MSYLPYLGILALGFLAGWLIAALRASAAQRDAAAQAAALTTQLAERERALGQRSADLENAQKSLDETRRRLSFVESDAAALRAQVAEKERSHADRLKELTDAQARLSESFKALAADALAVNSTRFLEQAKALVESSQKAASGEMEKQKAAVEGLVKPIRESLDKVGLKIGEIEKVRAEAYGGLMEQVKQLGQSQTQLQSETTKLVQALRAPQTRGRWGEMTLRRVVEMAGMSEHCDFAEQVSVESDAGRLRPDLIVKLPGGRVIVVDAKVSLKSYLDAIEAPNEEERVRLLIDHARQLKEHVKDLGGKSYFQQFQHTPDFVVAFIPGDPFLGAALEKDPELMEFAIGQRVLITTPETLIALLKTVAYGWRQESIEENAQKISELGKELYERVSKMAEHFAGLGAAIERSVKSYNDTLGTLESRVLVSTRKFRELQAAGPREIPEIGFVEHTVRELQSPELRLTAGSGE